jgi:DNA-binding MarR family transcriptional regulator
MTTSDDATYRDTIQNFLTLYRYLRHYGRHMSHEGLSGRKVSTLRYLAGVGPLTIGELSDYLCISDSSTSLLIDKLEKRGFVTRARSPHDNRVVLVDVTPSGRETVKRIPLGGIPRLREALKSIAPEQLDLVHRAMVTLVDILEIDNGH